MNEKVLLALSGGVDSAVSAYLLKEAAYDVEAVFFRFHDNYQQAESSAKKLAETMSLPFRVMDARTRFKSLVETFFIEAYRKGLTPNPCAYCNANLKMKLLHEATVAMDFDYFATGHYARLHHVNNDLSLRRGGDLSKDQSYFLAMVPEYILNKTIFPLGDMKKLDVKELAKDMSLPVPSSESQDVCFIGKEMAVSDFLSAHLADEPGQILGSDGEVLGQHRGLWRYTIGQRKGIELGGNGPYYVVERDFDTKTLIVSSEPLNSKSLYKKSFKSNSTNFLCDWPDGAERDCYVTVRYQHPVVSCRAVRQGTDLLVELEESLRAVVAGQLACFYDDDRVLAGAWISD